MCHSNQTSLLLCRMYYGYPSCSQVLGFYSTVKGKWRGWKISRKLLDFGLLKQSVPLPPPIIFFNQVVNRQFILSLSCLNIVFNFFFFKTFARLQLKTWRDQLFTPTWRFFLYFFIFWHAQMKCNMNLNELILGQKSAKACSSRNAVPKRLQWC